MQKNRVGFSRDDFGDERWCRGTGGLQHGRCADGEREREGVPEAIGVEHGTDRVAPVLGADTQDVSPVGLAGDPDVVVTMHGQLRPSGRPRGAQPESWRLGPRGVGRRVGGSTPGEEVRPSEVAVGAVAGVDDRGDFGATGQQVGDRLGACVGHDGQPGPCIGHDHREIATREQGIDGNRHGADSHGAEEHRDELDGIEHDHRHSFLGPDAETPQRRRHLEHAGVHVCVGERLALAPNGRAVAVTPVEVTIDQPFAGVETVVRHRVPLERISLRTATRWMPTTGGPVA